MLSCASNANLVQSSSTGSAYVVPSGGVITRWRHNGRTAAPAGSGRLLVWRPTADPTQFILVAKSEVASFSVGTLNEFDTRLPLQAGDLLGIRTVDNGMACHYPGASMSDVIRADTVSPAEPAVGSTLTLNDTTIPTRRLNAAATLEPDADNDGFGDETQDCAPGDASLATDCPPPPDTAAPNTTITDSPKAKTKKKKTTFQFTGTDARAVPSFECSLNGAPFSSCTSPLTVKGKRGKNTFAVRAKDAAGNVDATPASFDWKVKKKKKKNKKK